MIKSNFKVAPVIGKFERLSSLAGDMRPILMKIRGEDRDTSSFSIIGGIQRQFISEGTFYGAAWAPLKPAYQKQKSKKYPGKSTLIASGRLFNSLTSSGADYNVQVLTQTKLTWGTVLPYAKWHLTGTKKMKRRPPIGINDDQKQVWKNLIARYLTELETV